MHLLFSGSFKRPRIILSIFSSSFIRLPISQKATKPEEKQNNREVSVAGTNPSHQSLSLIRNHCFASYYYQHPIKKEKKNQLYLFFDPNFFPPSNRRLQEQIQPEYITTVVCGENLAPPFIQKEKRKYKMSSSRTLLDIIIDKNE